MAFKALSDTVSASPQLSPSDVAFAAAAGFKTIVCNRPDGEELGQPTSAEIAEAARAHGIRFEYAPVVSGAIGDDAVARMNAILNGAAGPVLAYCRSGTRSATLWGLVSARAGSVDTIVNAARAAGYDLASIAPRLQALASANAPAGQKNVVYDVVIVGGGAAGIATAASLLKRRTSLSIAVVEPSDTHFYQPGWTMVGGGIFDIDTTRRPMASVLPAGVKWIQQAAASFAPEANEVTLADGSTVRYRVLVAAPGLKLDWNAIPGLVEALGRNGVTSNYRFDLAPYTTSLVRETRSGRALFTQPAMPIKCAGAPQKAMYLSCDTWRRAGVLGDMQVEFHTATPTLFGVAAYVPALMSYVERYGIDLNFESRLVAVDGARKFATFERKGSDGVSERVEREFDMLHVVPPQVAHDCIKTSPLAAASGWIDVDQATMQHVRYPNVFALGDASSTANAKTAAAARKQAPIVALNVLATLDGKAPVSHYDGYGSCPLTVEQGRIVFAEFGYGGKLLPTFPSWLMEGTKPTRLAWFIKATALPPFYWNGMLKGREWFVRPLENAPRA